MVKKTELTDLLRKWIPEYRFAEGCVLMRVDGPFPEPRVLRDSVDRLWLKRASKIA
jgi:hypothetical protein